MATAAKSAASEIVGSILLLPVTEIEIGERLRAVDPEWAETLGRVMQVDGQNTPIEVCRLPGRANWLLVAGAHRLTGAISAGLEYVRAIEVDNNAFDRRMREISENVWRRGLDPLDRAAFVGDMHELLRARAGIAADQSAQSIAANARWQKAVEAEASDATDIVSGAYGITADIAEQLGLNERTIRRDLTLRRRLQPSDLASLRDAGHPILRNGAQLLGLAKLESRERSEVIRLLVAGTVKSVSEGTALLSQKTKPSPQAKALSAFIGSFARMGITEKKGALAELKALLPKGFQITTPDDVGELAEVRRALASGFRAVMSLIDDTDVEIETLQQAAQDMQNGLIVIDTVFGDVA